LTTLEQPLQTQQKPNRYALHKMQFAQNTEGTDFTS